MPSLSKSSFLRGSQCKKSLYLHWHRPELRDPTSPMQQAIFSQGTEIGKIAQQLFPGGKDAGIYVPDEYGKSIEMTSQMISEGADVIYEAGFSTGNLHCFVDILVRDGDGWKAYEVKSSTQVKPVNLLDAAFQYYVMTTYGLKVYDISLVVINTAYERDGEIDIRQLFRIEPVQHHVLKRQDWVKKHTAEFLATIELPGTPEIGIGPQCSDPYDCDFRGHCWQHVPRNSVFDIAELVGPKKWGLYNRGIIEMKDVPADFPLSKKQWQQVHCELTGEAIIDRGSISNFLESLSYPLYFLDFESFQPAVPLFNHSRPYQQIVFQYSLHIQGSPGAPLEHMEFLAEADGSDPRRPFIESLIRDIGTTGDIIVYNQAFEALRLREIAGQFPEYQQPIEGILRRIKDLMAPFRQRHYYTPAMQGSYSIKQVYPALVPGEGYNDLTIADGGSASLAFMSLVKEKDSDHIKEIRHNLLEYCKMDTLAMVEIVKKLRLLIGVED